MTYTDTQLLTYAAKMLTTAREDQLSKTRKATWLIDNVTYRAILARVTEIGEQSV